MRQSAGILLYRTQSSLEVLLVHPGGPFWKDRDLGAWSIPKGEFTDEDPLEAARREFREETGFAADGPFHPLPPVRQKAGKQVLAWAAEGDLDPAAIRSNTFQAEWPYKSGRWQSYPEIDRAGWFPPEEARSKINPAQAAFIDALEAWLKPAPAMATLNPQPEMGPKRPIRLSTMLKRIEEATASFPKAAMFELYEKGFTSLFEQLLSCIISIRTLDEVTIPLSLKVFEKARTPKQLLRLNANELETLLQGSQFPGQKAYTLLGIAKAAEDAGGELQADYTFLTGLKGVGPKCAKLALGVAAGHPGISVDSHVHRVVNRWGLVQTATPEKTMEALEAKVPQERWIDINRLLMPFGKHICTPALPRCSTCPVLEYCRQVGVTKHR